MPEGRFIDVLPDVSGVDRAFVYVVPGEMDLPEIGTVVAVRLAGRRVRGWVLGPVAELPDTTIRPIDRIVTLGPDARLVELGRFAARRYAGPLRPFLKSATPDRIVAALPPPARPAPYDELEALTSPAVLDAIGSAMVAATGGAVVVRTGPAESRLGVVAAAACVARGRDLLVLVPEHRDAEILASRLGRAGVPLALASDSWARAAAGGSIVVGTRRAAFARVGDLGGIVILDAHAESYIEERAPTAHATVIATERARLAGVPCLLVSPTPTLEQVESHEVVALEGSRGWPVLEVIDRTGADPHSGAYDARLVAAIRGALESDDRRRVLCVLNRTGRVRLLGCGACDHLQRCEQCGHALAEPARAADGEARRLVCPSCGAPRPFVCDHCGSTRLRQRRAGVSRATEELAALIGIPAFEVSASTTTIPDDVRLLVGTEAVLHRVGSASLVAFVDFDNELLATRLRASEQAYVMLGRAARLLGGMTGERHRRLVVQTRLPDDSVLAAARTGDPSKFFDGERTRRTELRLPPFAALALASGDEVDAFVAAVGTLGAAIECAPRPDGSYLVRATDHPTLLDAIAAVEATGVHCRIAVDPDDI